MDAVWADDTSICIFLNENVRISIKISLKFVPMGPINNIQALVQIMAWRRSGDKPLYEPMMVSLLTHICVTRPQWVNSFLLLHWAPNQYLNQWLLDSLLYVCDLVAKDEPAMDLTRETINEYCY